MIPSFKLFSLVALSLFLIFGEVVSPTEAQEQLNSLEQYEAFLDPTFRQPNVFWATVTAYASVPHLTDDTPFETADGGRVREGVVAANFLPFGTKLKIHLPGFEHRVFTVRDRMNRRYNRFAGNIDIWLPTERQAINFGVHNNTLIEIVSTAN